MVRSGPVGSGDVAAACPCDGDEQASGAAVPQWGVWTPMQRASRLREELVAEVPGVTSSKNNEIAKCGQYRTKDLALAEYDRMAAAGLSLTTPLADGENYTSTLTPPPGRGPRHPAEPATD